MGGLAADETQHEVVVEFGVYFGHDLGHILADETVAIETQSRLDVIVAVEHHSQVVADRVDCDYGDVLILAEL